VTNTEQNIPRMMRKRDVVCLLGNSGCGKSSVCELFNVENNHPNDIIMTVAGRNRSGIEMNIHSSFIDALTLEYTFDSSNFNQIKLPDETVKGERIYWIILDCAVDTILTRIKMQAEKQIWTTSKALQYLQQRYRYLGAHFGIPIIDTTERSLKEVHNNIIHIVQVNFNYYRYYRQIGSQTLDYDTLQNFNIENILYRLLKTDDMDQITDLPEYAHEFPDVDKQRLYIRWYVNNHSLELNAKRDTLDIGDSILPITGPIFQLITEGESKQVYKDISGNPFTKDLAFIVLKSTIYSHSMQVTGEIKNLGEFPI
jgi:ABC-type dipeptide/oligopeptide/nickel transport system ATPase component